MVVKVIGMLEYGIDFFFDNMFYVLVWINLGMGFGVVSFDVSVVEGLCGVQEIVELWYGVVVVVDNIWCVFKVFDVIDIDWEDGFYFVRQDEIWSELVSVYDGLMDSCNKDEGDVESVLVDVEVMVFEVEYCVFFLVYVFFELMNVIVYFQEDCLEIWIGLQIFGFIQMYVVEFMGFDFEQIFVYVQLMGGSFGCCFEDMYVLQVIEIVQVVFGWVIKMIWSCEEDMIYDYLWLVQFVCMCGVVKDGVVMVYDFVNLSLLVMNLWFGCLMGLFLGFDVMIVLGVWDQLLVIFNYCVMGYCVLEMVLMSLWCFVGNLGVGFQYGGFFDEFFVEVGFDLMDEFICFCSYDFLCQVFEEFKEFLGWMGCDFGENCGCGVVFVMFFGVLMVEVVEVINILCGIQIDKVFVVCEVGIVFDLVNIEVQIIGGVVWGFGYVMNCEFIYENFVLWQMNYYCFEGMWFYQMLQIVVKVFENGDEVKGIGEFFVLLVVLVFVNVIFVVIG